MALWNRYLPVAGALAVAGAAAGHLWLHLPAAWTYLAAVNLVTAAAYALDKRAAMRGRPRWPEASLHLLAAAGGSPAALTIRGLLRHKTRKRGFRAVLWGIFAAQSLAAAAWIYFTQR